MTVYFQSSSRLTFVWRKHWIFFIIDILFWSANSFKFVEGAWVAILISFILFFIGFYWHYGKKKIKKIFTYSINNSQIK
jgi:K+ transporter